MSEFEEKMGNHFVASRRDQKLVGRGSRILAGITVPVAALNYFIAPTERMTYTAVPILGAAALLGFGRMYEKLHDSIQNDIVELGTRDFLDTQGE